jgi:hypothetical protein
MAALGFSLIKSSEPYQHGLNAAKANSAVIAAMGSPVEAGVLVNGKIHTTNDSGDADLAIPVSGPKGSGKVFVTATRSAGVWSYSAVVFKADGSPKRINLEPTPTP